MDLETWLGRRDVAPFPFDDILERYWRVGKHFVDRPTLDTLDRLRRRLAAHRSPCAGTARALAFLDVALDKYDGRYDYRSYLALPLLPLPETGGSAGLEDAARRRDQLAVRLVADVLDFELGALDGERRPCPQMRADATLVAKRCRLALRAIAPALRRMGLCEHATADGDEPDRTGGGAGDAAEDCADRRAMDTAHGLRAAVCGAMRPDEAAALRITLLPVYVLHDEVMFLRVLQAFETCFTFLCTALEAGIAAIEAGAYACADAALAQAEAALHEAGPLFSLMATMRVEAFRAFRQYTEGASAIQSRAYKTMEALCAPPRPERLDSPGYEAVPEVRRRITSGWKSIEGAVDAAHRAGRLDREERDALRARMGAFEARVLAWRKTHHSLAVRMAGPATGTGYTEGTPYLRAVMTTPLFACTRGR